MIDKQYWELNKETQAQLDDLEYDQRDIVCDQAVIFVSKGGKAQINNYIRYAREMLYSPDVEFEKQEEVLSKLSVNDQTEWQDSMIQIIVGLAHEGYSYVPYHERIFKELFKDNPLTDKEMYDLVYTSYSYCEYAIECALERI